MEKKLKENFKERKKEEKKKQRYIDKKKMSNEYWKRHAQIVMKERDGEKEKHRKVY